MSTKTVSSIDLNKQKRSSLESVGHNVVKVDMDDKITGKAKYGSDIQPDGILHAAVVRSRHVHAIIQSVDISAAESMEGVRAIVTRDQLLGQFDNRVRYYGDVIAAVAATTHEVAIKAAESIISTLEPLPSIHDPKRAIQSGSPKVHDVNNPNFGQHGRHEFVVENSEYVQNIDDYHYVCIGDVEEGFLEADFIFEHEYISPRVNPCNLDTHCTIAEWDGDTVVFTETLGAPSRSRDEIADLMGIPHEQVRVVMPPVISSSFGARSVPQLSFEPVAATLSREAGGVPVKLWFDREEEFTATDHRHQTFYNIKMGITSEGIITAAKIDLVADTGAYPNGVGHIVLSNGLSRPLEIYKIPHYEFEGVSAFTNNLIAGEFRGIGSTQLGYALESHMDEMARRANIDPITFRLLNFVEEGYARPNTGRPIESCGLVECVERGLETFKKIQSGPSEDPEKLRGWGMAAGTHTTGLGAVDMDSSEVKFILSPTGSLTVEVEVLDHGQGTDTVMTQIASEETGIDISNILVRHYADTDSADAYLGSVASRSTYITGLAVQEAGRNLLTAIADILPAPYDPKQHSEISIADNCVSFGSDSIPLSDLFEESLISTGFAESELNPPAYGAHFAEVEVDALTGHVDILSYVAAQDVGFAINPKMVEGQLEGAISQGIEFALRSEVKLDRGIPLNPNLADYSVISPWEMPKTLICEIVESNEESGPYGAKGIGTPAMPPIAPAIINAIRDATGIRFSKAPVESEHIAMALLKNKGGSP